MTATLQPEEIRAALTHVLQEDVTCAAEDDDRVVQVDTPYILQDGRLLRVYFEPTGNNGNVLVTDGGYAASLAALFSRTAGARRGRYGDFRQIATELDLSWDSYEFSFEADDILSAARRIAVLARAVDRALTALQPRPRRAAGTLRAALGPQLRAEGLEVTPRAQILAGLQSEPVRVDYLIRRRQAEAAVEVLTGQTERGAWFSVNEAVADFAVLVHGEYPGLMVAVYDEESPAAQARIRDRFRAASPERVELIPGRQAAPWLAARLAG